ncbi:hypothetical protein M8756_17120 [Lutimaribacter sp. EGI FJ00015]|uniref:Uncharacterized protein n=1 Tax=Lutimaribacter degradans TaxID=2945989 RepID=A0ACC6A0I2_9RHOB|nr:calcium-binding protein [Lutimaribacter sp. EGI FJ00013]MCM2563865.1 hypothetical protein [Lutimaribacter sp. EGI FJ00013]MCO0615036.1 hypothetical protein [Lutimaribacter sp. EGI FJ00015]MCO0637708.1 hypothetical protein [Lutimaribacter sp. EGI FJ00014]
MPTILHRAVIGADLSGLQNDIRALEVVPGDRGPTILAAGGPNGALVSLSLGAGGVAGVVSATPYTDSIAASLTGEVAVLEVDGVPHAIVGQAAGEGLVGYALEQDGTLGPAATVAMPALQAGATGVLAVSAAGFVHVASGSGTVTSLAPDAQGRLRGASVIHDSAGSHLASPVEMVTAQLGGRSYLLTLCADEDGVSAFAVDAPTGRLAISDSLGAQNGMGILDMPVALELARAGGRTFLVVASSADQGQGGALSVMELTTAGGLRPVDHVLDTLATRFGRVQDMAVVTHEGRSYVVVAGGDDGISLFTMLPDGRLLHLDTIADSGGRGLASISAMTAAMGPGGIEILVASHDQPGLSQFTVPLAGQGITRQVASGRLDGTGRDDLLSGGAGAATLVGGAGNDTLADGQGHDRLTGGAGADVFLLEPDDARDVITDFEPGRDRIDLTLYPMLYSTDQVEISTTAWGALMTIRGDVTEIRRAGGGPISAGELRAALDWETGRVPMALPDETRGTPGDDTLVGDWRSDLLIGAQGNDLLDGLAGSDRIEGGQGRDTLRGGDGADTLNAAAGNDRLEGGAGDDMLRGGNGFDRLLGGAGNDTLVGGNGRDTLRGGAGDDVLRDTGQGGAPGRDLFFGGAGDDTILGRGGNDTAHGGAGDDVIHGRRGDDFLRGGNGVDRLFGGNGDDRLEGGNGRDILRGGAGDDMLRGGGGFDRLLGGNGDDRLVGGSGRDTLRGGAGDDMLRGGNGVDRLLGGNGDDTLVGGNGRDTLRGGAGDDVLDGGGGGDRLDGRGGHDTLLGGANADTLIGGGGRDVLEAGQGFDLLIGGAGADVFVFRGGDGVNRVRDFTPGRDQLHLDVTERGFADLAVSGTDQGLRLDWSGGAVILEGVSAAGFDASDVIFL